MMGWWTMEKDEECAPTREADEERDKKMGCWYTTVNTQHLFKILKINYMNYE